MPAFWTREWIIEFSLTLKPSIRKNIGDLFKTIAFLGAFSYDDAKV